MQVLTVYDLPVVTLDPWDDVCLDTEPIALSGGMPEGGTYSGPGVSDGTFDPAVAGAGTHTITYTYEDENGCSNFAEETLTVNNLPEPELGPDTTVCADQSIILDATIPGATAYEWYPGGQTSAQITVDTTGIGIGTEMFIVYVTDENDCVGMDSITIEFEDCTGIGELAGVNNITLYPNPGQGEFNLQVEAKTPIELNVEIYNNKGVTVYEKQGIRVSQSELIRLDLSTQAEGIYLVNVYNQQGKWVEKLIIRK
jgi:hypothetical protein